MDTAPASELNRCRKIRTADGEVEWRPNEGARMALVVDDEGLVRSLTSRILEAEGFTVVQGESGEQAAHIAKRLGSRIELVLLDLAMPERDGAMTLPTLRTLLARTPIIVMTELVAGEPQAGWRMLDSRSSRSRSPTRGWPRPLRPPVRRAALDQSRIRLATPSDAR